MSRIPALWRPGQVVLLAGVLCLTGCTYMKNRGSDFTDVFDAGVTVSKKPQFTLYANFLSLLSLGYAHFDGTLYGMADRHYGAVTAREHAAGLLVWGREQFGYETFDLADPESPPSWRVGLVGLPMGPAPPKGQTVNCPKMLHLGWVGITLNCKFGQLADFILGLTTLDIMGDDTAGRPEKPPAALPAAEAGEASPK